jgi:hypothetical protein
MLIYKERALIPRERVSYLRGKAPHVRGSDHTQENKWGENGTQVKFKRVRGCHISQEGVCLSLGLAPSRRVHHLSRERAHSLLGSPPSRVNSSLNSINSSLKSP